MKKIVILIFLSVLMYTSYAQVPDTCFSKPQIKNIYNNIKVLEFRDSMHQEIIYKYKEQITDFESLKISDSITKSSQKIQIQNLQQNNKDLNTINKLIKPKWYQLPIVVSTITFISTISLISIFK